MTPPENMRSLCNRISNAIDIPGEKRRLLLADLDRFIELVPAVATIRPHGACLRPYFGQLHTVHTGLSPKRIANLISNVRGCLRWSYATWPRASKFPELRFGWAHLHNNLPPRSKIAMWLSRIIHWANFNEISPHQISDKVFHQFCEYLDKTAAVLKPLRTSRQVARHWNLAASTVPDWPQIHLSLPTGRTGTRAPTIADLSASMAADLETYKISMTGKNAEQINLHKRSFRRAEVRPTTLDQEPHIYADTTIKQREQLLRRAIGLAALEQDCPVSDLRNLSVLVAPGMAGAILDRYDEELGRPEKAPASLRLMSLTLYVMARRYLKMPDDVMLGLRNIIGEAGPEQFGMTEKNLSKLRSLTPRQFELLFQLPATLLSKSIKNIRKNKAGISDLIDAQTAVAIAILLHAPLRGTNLCSIKIGNELIISPLPNVEARLVFAPETVKNNVRLDFPIPSDVAALIRKFIQEVMPEFHRSGFTPALFPGLKSETKGVSHLGSQIASRISKAIGIRLNQHLFRHLLAYIYLARNPGRYDVVQYLLGHKSVETTKKYYCGAEIEAAIRDVAKHLANIKVEYGLDPNDMSKLRQFHSKG